MIAFDADCLIYAAAVDHPLGAPVYALLVDPGIAAVGSVLLLPELLIKPARTCQAEEEDRLLGLLGRIELISVHPEIARLAVVLGAKYRLRAIDSVHLATAVVSGADRFITNNRRDFARDVSEIDVTYPASL